MEMSKNIPLKEQTPLADKNWFKTGGNARFYIAPNSTKSFQAAVSYANSNNLDLFLLGQGANILISDDGFDGLVIHPHMTNISHESSDKQHILVHAGAGVSIENLITYCLQNNITGLEEFSGIPGTVGGSVYINIHYFQFFLSQFLVGGTVIDRKSSATIDVDKNWFQFGYDTSTLMIKDHYLASATFKLKKASDIETAHARGRSQEIIRHRNARYPQANTCGSFFRNFLENEVTDTIAGTDKKMIYVGYYLDKVGIKGALRQGGAVVSHKHANMIVNTENATSTDIIDLAREMQCKVKEAFGIVPQPECQLIGFKKYPLLR